MLSQREEFCLCFLTVPCGVLAALNPSWLAEAPVCHLPAPSPHGPSRLCKPLHTAFHAATAWSPSCVLPSSGGFSHARTARAGGFPPPAWPAWGPRRPALCLAVPPPGAAEALHSQRTLQRARARAYRRFHRHSHRSRNITKSFCLTFNMTPSRVGDTRHIVECFLDSAICLPHQWFTAMCTGRSQPHRPAPFCRGPSGGNSPL